MEAKRKVEQRSGAKSVPFCLEGGWVVSCFPEPQFSCSLATQPGGICLAFLNWNKLDPCAGV